VESFLVRPGKASGPGVIRRLRHFRSGRLSRNAFDPGLIHRKAHCRFGMTVTSALGFKRVPVFVHVELDVGRDQAEAIKSLSCLRALSWTRLNINTPHHESGSGLTSPYHAKISLNLA